MPRFKDRIAWQTSYDPRAHWNLAEHVAAEYEGYPTPQFVAWLMGWPMDWTSLEPLETDKFQQWQQQHSGCFQAG